MKSLLLILFVFIIFNGLELIAQTNPEALGIIVFNCYKNDSVSKLENYFPSVDQLIQYSKTKHLDVNEELIKLLKNNYPDLIKELNKKLISFQTSPIVKDILWETIHLDSICSKFKKSPRADSDSDSLEINRLEIHFQCNSHPYQIVFENIIHIEGRWYLDNKVHFRDLIEEK